MGKRLNTMRQIFNKSLFFLIPLSFVFMTILEMIYGRIIVGNKDASLSCFFVIEGSELVFLLFTIIYIIIVEEVEHRKFTLLINLLIFIALLNMFYFFALHQLFNSSSPLWYPVLRECNGLWFTTDRMMLNTYIDPSIDPELETFIVYSSKKDINGNTISSVILVVILVAATIYYKYVKKHKNV